MGEKYNFNEIVTLINNKIKDAYNFKSIDENKATLSNKDAIYGSPNDIKTISIYEKEGTDSFLVVIGCYVGKRTQFRINGENIRECFSSISKDMFTAIDFFNSIRNSNVYTLHNLRSIQINIRDMFRNAALEEEEFSISSDEAMLKVQVNNENNFVINSEYYAFDNDYLVEYKNELDRAARKENSNRLLEENKKINALFGENRNSYDIVNRCTSIAEEIINVVNSKDESNKDNIKAIKAMYFDGKLETTVLHHSNGEVLNMRVTKESDKDKTKVLNEAGEDIFVIFEEISKQYSNLINLIIYSDNIVAKEAIMTNDKGVSVEIRNTTVEFNVRKKKESKDEDIEIAEDKANDAEDKANDAEDKVARYKKYFYESIIKNKIEEVVKKFETVYGPGMTGLGSVGLLVSDRGTGRLINIKSSEGYSAGFVDDSWIITDNQILQGIEQACGDIRICDKPEETGDNQFCINYQTYFMTANIKLAKGLCSIRTFVKEKYNKDIDTWCKEDNDNTVRISEFSIVKEWWAYCIEKIIYSELIRRNVEGIVTLGDKRGDEEVVTNVTNYVTRALKNTICVAERNIGINYKIRVSLDNLDDENIVNKISDKVNSGGNNIKVKVTSISNGVATINVIFDSKKYNKSDKFASEIAFDEEGNIRNGFELNWGHALLGKKLDDNYFFWDEFKKTEKISKRIYAIYAESGAGKGIMTSSLLANAVASGEKVFYLDGKPENGPTIGQVAWHRGYEAFVFNGLEQGAAPFEEDMEAYTNGLRSVKEVTDYCASLPKEIFNTEEFTRKFLAFMRYMRGFEILTLFIDKRSRSRNNDWQVWVLDEMTKMSRTEKEIREAFATFMSTKDEIAKSVVKDGALIRIKENSKLADVISPEGSKYDEGVAYVYNWLKWMRTIVSRYLTGVTANIRKANLNIIFIFQNAVWLCEHDEITSLREIVAKSQCTKILGNGGLARNCGEYGDGTLNKAWFLKLQNEPGTWAISNTVDIRKDDNPVLFKPYKLWTIPLAGSKNDPKCYFENYVVEYCNQIGFDPAKNLQNAWDDAENLVIEEGYADSLKKFMYDVSDLKPKYKEFSLEELQNREVKTNDILNSVLTNENSSENTETDNDTSNKSDFDIINDKDSNEDFGEYEYEILNSRATDTSKAKTVRSDFNEKEIEKLSFSSTGKLRKIIMESDTDATLISRVYYNKILNSKMINISKFDVNNFYMGEEWGLAGLIRLASNVHMMVKEGFLSEKYMYQYDRRENNARIIEMLYKGYTAGEYEYDAIVEEVVDYIEKENQRIKEGSEIDIEDDRYKGPNIRIVDKEIVAEEDFTVKKEVKTPTEVVRGIRQNRIINKINSSRYERKNYIAYDFRNIWDSILNDIDERYKRAQINSLKIIGARVEVNNKAYRYDDVLSSSKYDISFRDIFKIKETIKRYKNLNELWLEAKLLHNCKRQLDAKSTEEIFEKIFKNNKSIDNIYIVKIREDGVEVLVGKIDRNGNQIDKEVIRREELSNKVGEIASRINENSNEIKTSKSKVMSARYDRRQYSNIMYQKAIESKNPVKTVGYAILGRLFEIKQ